MGHIAVTSFQKNNHGAITRAAIPVDDAVVGVSNIVENPRISQVPKALRDVFSMLSGAGERLATAHIKTRNAHGTLSGQTILLPKQDASMLMHAAIR